MKCASRSLTISLILVVTRAWRREQRDRSDWTVGSARVQRKVSSHSTVNCVNT